MAEYQNLFTQVQAVGPPHLGVPLAAGQQPAHRQRPAAACTCSAASATRRSGRSTWAAWASRR